MVIEKPYTFIPPYRGNTWPTWIQRLRLVDRYLHHKEGVVSYECRHRERLQESLSAGHGIVLAPNHCRYADPLALGWLARETKTHVYAMASRHLFESSAFESFAIRRMGAFSVWREGLDRQSIEAAIDIVARAERPLILFPEGSTFRTNDRLQPLLDGVAFIARTAARRRAKSGGTVVMHPIAIKYVFKGDIESWAAPVIERLEKRLTWFPRPDLPLLPRIERLWKGYLAVKEIEYAGSAGTGSLAERAGRLLEHLIEPVERAVNGAVADGPPVPRIKALRPKLLPRLLNPETVDEEAEQIRHQLRCLDLGQQLASYPHGYLTEPPVTNTRILETLQRMEEDILDKKDRAWPGPLHAIMEVAEGFVVEAKRMPRDAEDPMLRRLRTDLGEMIDRLQHESPLYTNGCNSADS